MEEKGFIFPELGTGDFYTPGLQFQEPWPGGNIDGFSWLNEPGMDTRPGSRDSGTRPNPQYNSAWAEWDDKKNAYIVDKGQSSYKTSDGTKTNLLSTTSTSRSGITLAGDAREAAEETESKKTETPHNCLTLKDAGDPQSEFHKNIGTVISELEIEEQIVSLKLMVLFPLRPEHRPGFGENLPHLPVPQIEPLSRTTVGRREPTEDEERSMIEANTMNKYIYLTRAYVFEYQKMFPLMHQKNLEDHGENYGWMECMELYRYAVKKHAANIPGFIPGLMSPG